MFDLSFFEREGFQIIPSLIPVEVIEKISKFLVAEKDQTVSELCSLFNLQDEKELSSYIVDLGNDVERLNSFDRSLQLQLSGHFSLQTRLSPEFLSIARLPSIKTLFNTIFPDQKPCLHMPPTARFVLPNNSFAGVPAHQDVSYNEHMDDFFVLWIPFSEITDLKGGVQVYKGTSQQKQFSISKDNNFWLPGIEIENAEKIHCKMKAGDVLLLNKWIVHASVPNVSDEIRISTDFRFFYGDSKKHYFDFEKDQVISPL